MGVIKQLNDTAGNEVYPVSKTSAVYDDNIGGRLDTILKRTVGFTEEEVDHATDPQLDADRLGGLYTAADITKIKNGTVYMGDANDAAGYDVPNYSGDSSGTTVDPDTVVSSATLGDASAAPRDADTLGGTYSADDITQIKNEVNCQYSSIKRKTGRKWIDGKDIYELAIKKTLGTVTSGTVIDDTINYSNIDSLIRFTSYFKNTSASTIRVNPVTPASNYGAYVYITNNGLVVNGSSNALGDISNTIFSCVIEYTEN